MSKLTKYVLIVLGTLSLALGIIGAFLPVLPTTPFVLLAVFCYVRSSQRMYDWVVSSRFAGKHVRNILAGKGIPLSVKIFSVAISICMIGYVGIFRTENTLLRSFLVAIVITQVYFMVRIKTLKPDRREDDLGLNLEP